MNAYKIIVGCDTRQGSRVGIVYGDKETADAIAESEAAKVGPNMIGWADYVLPETAESLVEDGLPVLEGN